MVRSLFSARRIISNFYCFTGLLSRLFNHHMGNIRSCFFGLEHNDDKVGTLIGLCSGLSALRSGLIGSGGCICSFGPWRRLELMGWFNLGELTKTNFWFGIWPVLFQSWSWRRRWLGFSSFVVVLLGKLPNFRRFRLWRWDSLCGPIHGFSLDLAWQGSWPT